MGVKARMAYPSEVNGKILLALNDVRHTELSVGKKYVFRLKLQGEGKITGAVDVFFFLIFGGIQMRKRSESYGCVLYRLSIYGSVKQSLKLWCCVTLTTTCGYVKIPNNIC